MPLGITREQLAIGFLALYAIMATISHYDITIAVGRKTKQIPRHLDRAVKNAGGLRNKGEHEAEQVDELMSLVDGLEESYDRGEHQSPHANTGKAATPHANTDIHGVVEELLREEAADKKGGGKGGGGGGKEGGGGVVRNSKAAQELQDELAKLAQEEADLNTQLAAISNPAAAVAGMAVAAAPAAVAPAAVAPAALAPVAAVVPPPPVASAAAAAAAAPRTKKVHKFMTEDPAVPLIAYMFGVTTRKNPPSERNTRDLAPFKVRRFTMV